MRFPFFISLYLVTCNGLLYPKDSPSRLVKELDGIWHFRIDTSPTRDEGFIEQWYTKPLAATGETIFMPVPSSYNDITQNATIRDFIGWAWYDRNFWLPESMLDEKTRIVLRFESAHYYTIVWVNGKQAMVHNGGHLPFEADITELLMAGQPNTVTAAVNNTLNDHTLPPGYFTYYNDNPRYPPGYFTFTGQFDFFNYAGIQRSVKLYTTPKTYIDDITVVTNLIDNSTANLHYQLKIGGPAAGASYEVGIAGEHDSGTVSDDGMANGTIRITNPSLWWPWTMSDTPGQLYPFQVKVTDNNGVSDMYRLSVGIRDILVTENQFLINGKPFYFHGVDKHEDWDILGKGINYALLMKDINLLKWLGVSAFRTSHYPYAEEMLDLCDKEGIVVIGESPAVGLQKVDNFAQETLSHHIEVMTEMIGRDKNRPSVVMWSVANEPNSGLAQAQTYFDEVFAVTRKLDPTRPVTFACSNDYYNDKVTPSVDVIMINRYYDWYDSPGHPEVAPYALRYDLEQWRNIRKKPIMISEYGAGTISGLHKDPPVEWSEEYQAEALMAYWPVFDEYRKSFFIGELIWNFADFETPQSTTRVDGNRKGILTRQRQPKLAAYLVRQRYLNLAQGKDYHPETIAPK